MNKLNDTFKENVFNAEKVKENIINNKLKEEYRMRKSSILAGIFIVAIVALVGYVGFLKFNDNDEGLNNEILKNEAVSFLTISINPEIELGLDENDEVVEIVPINSDADILTSDLDLVGLTVEEASEQIVNSAIETGYIDEYSDENTIVVTTVNDNEEKRKELEEKVMARMTTHFEARKIYPILVAKGLDDDLKAEAESYNISYGKMLLIERAISLNDTLLKEELINMSIKDIQTEINNYVKERHNALKESLQEAKTKWKEQKIQLKQDCLEKIEELKASITEENKEEFKNMTEEQKKEAIQNYLNARKEIIKNDVNAIKDELKSDIQDDMEDYNYPILENNEAAIKENVKERIQERRNNR